MDFISNFSIALLHIMLSGTDQFIKNILLLRGELNQVLRDIGLMIPDLLHVALPIIEYVKGNESGSIASCLDGKENTVSIKNRLPLFVVIKYCVFICFLYFIGNNL